jgi:hypothetical protein
VQSNHQKMSLVTQQEGFEHMRSQSLLSSLKLCLMQVNCHCPEQCTKSHNGMAKGFTATSNLIYFEMVQLSCRARSNMWFGNMCL